MSYARRALPAQPVNLQDIEEDERFINGGSLWCRTTIQGRLANMQVVASANAKDDLLNKLAWKIEDVKAFVSQLASAHYLNSQWCYTGKGSQAYPADAYCMGFNRHKGVENHLTDPWVYFKFSVIEQSHSIVVMSAHPEKKK